MPGLIIAGRIVPVPGVLVVNYLDDPRLRLTWRNVRKRPGAVTGIIGHSESGDDPHVVLDGNGPPDPEHGAHLADVDESDALAGRAHSQHLSICRDSVVFQFADLASEMTWHAPPANATTIGIEIDDRPATVPVTKPVTHVFYRSQLAAFVAVCDVVTREVGVQRQVHWPYRGPVDQLHGGVYGICGHRDQTADRGPGDPGDAPLAALIAARYESGDAVALAARWADRQRALAARGAQIVDDGEPGAKTRAAVRQYGDTSEQRRTGLWVARPGD